MTAAAFSADYRQARDKFIDVSRATGWTIESHRCPADGPDGQPLFTDVARLGPERCEKLLVTISATHGIEGFCGSAAQIATAGISLPGGVAFLQIHAINPYGFAWQRRVTQENVDLNRNFADFAAPPDNPGYERLHPCFLPARWDEPAKREILRQCDLLKDELGTGALVAAISRGQYRHADGIFYGGSVPTWSHRTLVAILERHCAGARTVAVIDYHSGLGPRGFGERICDHALGSGAWRRASAWYGDDITSKELGTAVASKLSGPNVIGVQRAAGPAEVVMITLEFGTVAREQVRMALLADNWLHQRGDPNSHLGRQIKADIRKAFYGEDSAWQEAILKRSLDTHRQTSQGLVNS